MNVPPAPSMRSPRKDPDTGDYVIPKIIYSDAYYSEMIPYADLILPDTTYLERWDCISLLDRPISEADGPADSIRQPVVRARPGCPSVPGRAARPRRRLGLPGFVTEDGAPQYPGGYSDYIVNHERAPGIGPLAGWRGEDGDSYGKGAPNPNQLRGLYREWLPLLSRDEARPALFPPCQPGLSGMGPVGRIRRLGQSDRLPPSIPNRCSGSGSPRAVTATSRRPRSTAPGSNGSSIRCPSGTRPSRKPWSMVRTSPCTPSPSGPWPCTIPGARRMPGCARSTAPTLST